MPDTAILQQLVIVLGAALLAIYFLQKIKIPPIVGYLLAGILIGPGGLSLVKDPHIIEIMAEIGVIFLLFIIGLNFSLSEIARMKNYVFIAGSLQVALTILATVLITTAAVGLDLRQAIFWGFLIAMSSTAIVVRSIEYSGESRSLHGQLMIGILIFQDLAVIPIMLMVAFLGNQGGLSWTGLAFSLAKSIAMVLALIASAHYLIPWILEKVVRSRSREVFTLTTIIVVLGTAFFAGQAGLSLAIGAFLAGIIVSDSNYSHQILSEISPLRDIFSGLFFVSIGMLVNPRLWMEQPLLSLGLGGSVILLKALLVAILTLFAGLGIRVGVLAGLGLAQIGEFSFIIAGAGIALGLMPDPMYQLFLSISVLTMAVTPLLMMLSGKLAGHSGRLSFLQRLFPGSDSSGNIKVSGNAAHPREEVIKDHAIIIGYGVGGRNVGRVLEQIDVKYFIVELNPRQVRALQAQDEAVIYGDAVRREVLLAAGIECAKALIVTIPDPPSARQIVALARRLNTGVDIIVRTRFVSEVDELYRLGANQVIAEEYQASLELASATMRSFDISDRIIARAREAMKQNRYNLLRVENAQSEILTAVSAIFSNASVEEISIGERVQADGKDLRSLDIRGATGAMVIAIERGGEIIANPGPDFKLGRGDKVFLFGKSNQIASARSLLSEESATGN